MSRYRVSMDIGGTFTDVVAYDEASGTYVAGKSSTTPHDLTEGVFAALDQVVDSPADIGFTVHGTTQGLNTFLQRRGEKILLLATKGAGDVYHIARGNRLRLYDIHYRKPTPLVPRSDIVEIPGRLNYAGEELEPLDEEAIRAAAQRVRDEGFGAVAVAYLFSYLNPAHELRTREILAEELDGIPVSLSHQVAREWREYERTSSTVVDAYIAPVVRRYLERLESEMQRRGLGVPLHVMQSSGGIVTAQSARDLSLQTLLSGPVGGTVGGVALARILDRPNLICVDMGGTSFDVSLVVEGKPDVASETTFEGFPLLMSVVNIHTIGAGGGSLAYSEAGGLRVGPQSAGAEPGPACYGRGGTDLTVTDANLLLGRVDERRFAGGGMHLDTEAARAAARRVGEPLGLDVDAVAEGVLDIVNAKMADAIRTITIRRGIDPRQFALVAYGGAGPMQAAFLADQLEIGEVLVPVHPGTFSAWGMLETDIRHDLQTTWFRPLGEVDDHEVEDALKVLEGEATELLRREHVAPADMRMARSVDLRYAGQEYNLTVALPAGPFDAATARAGFDAAYQRQYGHSNPDAPVELVNLRLAATGVLARPPAAAPAPAPRTRWPVREIRFAGQPRPTPVVPREELTTADEVRGPAVIEEPTATTVVPPGWTARVVHGGHVSLTQMGLEQEG